MRESVLVLFRCSLLLASLFLPALPTLVLAQQEVAQPAEPDPYAVLTGDNESSLRSYLDRIAEGHFRERDQAIAAIRTPEALHARQQRVVETVLRGFDGWPEKTPLRPRITGQFERDGYRVENLVFESMPGLFVTANVYIPTDPKFGRGPYPAVLGTAGHTNDGKAAETYQHGWIGLAKRGFLVIAYDPIGQGERLQYIDEDTGKSLVGPGTREHIMLGITALLTGTNFARYEIWDGVRAFDYLMTREDVDANRVAVVGNSGGGTQSAYLNLLEPRLAVAAPSCYITSWKQLWHDPGPQDAEQVFVDFIKDGFDFADFLTASAPRPVKMLAAIQDFFPIAGARAAYAEAQRMFALLGREDHVGYFEYDDTHGWSKPRREATYAWLDRWLYQRTQSEPEAKIIPEKEETLHVTTRGQVLMSLGGRSLQQIIRQRAQRVFDERKATALPAGDKAGFRTLLADTLRVLPRSLAGDERSTVVGAIRRDGYRIDKLLVPVGNGDRIPALLALPERAAANARLVVYVDDRGKGAEAGEQGLVASMAREGHAVLALDVRGIGEWGVEDGQVGYTPMYRESMRALLVGTTMAAIQAQDLLVAAATVSLPEAWRQKPIRFVGKGNMGWIAIYAAALAEGEVASRLEGIAAEEAPLSYNDIVRSPRHYFTTGLVVPGVLKAFDMPDVVAGLSARQVLLLNTRSPMEFLHARESVRHEYAAASIAFEAAGKADNLQILRETEDDAPDALRHWLKR